MSVVDASEDFSSTGKTLVMGVDPGMSGAIAIYDIHAKSFDIHDMPVKAVSKGKRILDLAKLAGIIDSNCIHISHAMVEKVHSMPKDGPRQAFKFGEAYGTVVGMLAAYYIPIFFLEPAVWKSSLGLSHKKEESITKIRKMFPQVNEHIYLKKHDGRAEACLLASLGAKYF